jgi:hypothetical protein
MKWEGLIEVPSWHLLEGTEENNNETQKIGVLAKI